MPRKSTSRPNPISTHKKRTITTNEDGWSTVSLSSSKSSTLHTLNDNAHRLPDSIPRDPDISLEKLQRIYEIALKKWLDSSDRDILHRTLQNQGFHGNHRSDRHGLDHNGISDQESPSSTTPIVRESRMVNKAVLLAVGSMTRADVPFHRSMYQLAAFKDLADSLLQDKPSHTTPKSILDISQDMSNLAIAGTVHVDHKGGHKSPVAQFDHNSIRLFAQDPAFDDLDARFLTSLGFSVLKDDSAHDEIDEQTFLFAAYMNARDETVYRQKAISAKCPLYATTCLNDVCAAAERKLAALQIAISDDRQSGENDETKKLREEEQAYLDVVASATVVKEMYHECAISDADEQQILPSHVYIRRIDDE